MLQRAAASRQHWSQSRFAEHSNLAQGMAQGRSNFEAVISEIESIEDYWSPTFRAIYENQDQENFVSKLDARVRSHTREIEKVCGAYHHGFMESIKQLPNVKNILEELKTEASTIQGESLVSIQTLSKETDELQKVQQIRHNITSTTESLEKCLPAFETYQQLQKDIAEKNYFMALGRIDELRERILPPLINLSFAQKLKQGLPQLVEKIKDGSLEDLRLFLEEARVYSSKVGKAAVEKTVQEMSSDDNPFGEESQENVEVSPEKYISFVPVYKAIHIFKKLDSVNSFGEYYRKQRFQQIKLTLQHSTNAHDKFENYEDYCHEIVGFFVTEDHLRRTVPSLVTTSFYTELWMLAVKQFNASVNSQVDVATNPDRLVRIKGLLVAFCTTMKQYGFDISELRAVLRNASDLYYEIAMQRCTQKLRALFDEDNYQPMEIATLDQEKKLIGSFHAPEEPLTYPKKYPFSAMVPKIYHLLKDYVLDCRQFVQDLSLSRRELAEVLSKAVTQLINRSLSGCFFALIKKTSLSILQVIQLSINIVHIEESMQTLETYIQDLNNIREGTQAVKLHGSVVFKDLRSEAENQIYERLHSKITEFFELSGHDWTLSEPSGQPSGFISDLRVFLKSTFSAFGFANLPLNVAQTACLSACQHVSKNFLERLLSDEVKAVSQSALQQLNLDLMQCEQFAASDPVPGFEDGALLLCFADVRQLFDLFLSGDWTNYFKDFGKETSKYIRVGPERCIILMENAVTVGQTAVDQAVAGTAADLRTTTRPDEMSRAMGLALLPSTTECMVTGVKPWDLLHGMGMSFVSFVGQYGYDRVLSVLGRNLRDFLNGLDNLHEYLRPSYPAMRSPSFFCDNETAEGLTLHFRCSKRTGLVYYTMGQIKQIGVNFFKTEMKIEILKEETFQMFNSVTFQLHFENRGFIESQLNSQCLIRDEQFLPVRADFIFETFPFSLSFDSSMKIECLGQSLHLVIPDAKGKLLGECFQLHRPLVKFTYETILARRNNIFELISEIPAGLRKNSSSRESRLTNGAVMPFSREVLQAKGQRPIHLKGQMLYLAEWNRIIYLASPLMTNLDALTDSGLYINDLSMHDFSRDVMMAGTQKSVELKLLLDQETIKSQKLQESMKKLDDEMKRTDELLYQMIPQSVADRLRHGASPMETCKSFDIVTILFSDVVQFTEISSRITPMEVVCLLNSMYSVYDQLTEIHQVYKVETIGDAYMIVGGVPEACHDHAERVCNMALGMIEGIRGVTEPSTGDPIQIRIGIHSGPVVAGVVGLKMPRYCLFGDTVNTASRMESNSRPMRIHISPRTRALLDSSYRIKDRGETQIKGKGIMKTYWVEGKEGLALRRVTSTGQFSDSQRGYTPVSVEDVAKRRPSDERRINGNHERIWDS